jgi:hypothetical protein
MLAKATPSANERDPQLSEAEQDAERCNDDRVRAEVAIAVVAHALARSTLGEALGTKLARAEVAVERVAQRDLAADLDLFRLEIARQTDHLDEAIARPTPNEPARRVRGRVVDRHGAPVADATVAAGRFLLGDAISAAAPFPWQAGLRRATTSTTGEFEILDAPAEGIVIAQLAGARSRPVASGDAVTLALQPTSRIEGTIEDRDPVRADPRRRRGRRRRGPTLAATGLIVSPAAGSGRPTRAPEGATPGPPVSSRDLRAPLEPRVDSAIRPGERSA